MIMDDVFTATLTPLRHSKWTVFVLMVAYSLALIAGLVGNIFVVAIVIKDPKMRTVTNFFILNLAVADLLVLTVCLPPTLVSNIYVPWVMGGFLCKAVPYIQGVAVCASVYSLVAITTDRFLGICFPMRTRIKKKQVGIVIMLIWTWASVLAFPWIFSFGLLNADESEPSHVFCVETWPDHVVNGNVYFVAVNFVLFYIFPLSLISICYFAIWIRVHYRHVPADTSSISNVDSIHQRAKASVIKTVVVVVVTFAISWLPLYAIFLRIKLVPVELSAWEEKVLDLALPMAQWLGASHSSVNPFLYAIFNRKFRRAFFQLLRRRRERRVAVKLCNSFHLPHEASRPSLILRSDAAGYKLENRKKLCKKQAATHSSARAVLMRMQAQAEDFHRRLGKGRGEKF